MDQIRMNKVSNRLKTLIKHCEKADVWADIGCDHGYVTLALLKENKANMVYATDIHSESLEKTKILIKNHNLENKVKFCVGDGFLAINQEELANITNCIIAGMGGQEIIKILKVYSPENLVLQPMKNTVELRKFLMQNYDICKDFVFQEKNKFYNILICKKGNCTYTNNELLFGKTNLEEKTQDFKNYLMDLKSKNQLILDKHYNKETLNILQNIENVLNLFK